MSEHTPKIYALEALVRDELSAQGRARIERHVEGCDVCRRALIAIRSYESLRNTGKLEPVPELSWERMERALDVKAPAPAQRANTGRVIALAWPLLAVAATVLIAWLGLSGQPAPVASPEHAVKQPSVAQVEVEKALAGFVTLRSGGARLAETGAQIELGAPVRDGSLLHTEAGSELHVALADRTGIVIGPGSDVRIVRLSEHNVRIEVLKGSVFSRVRKLSSGETYEVSAGGVVAQVRGTRFTVEQQASTSVTVHEGRVAVSRGGSELALLEAGQRWQSAPRESDMLPSDRAVYALDPAARSWSTLSLAALPEMVAFHIGEVRVVSSGNLSMRAPVGELELGLEDAKGQIHTVKVQVAPEGTTLDENALSRLIAPRPEAAGYLAPEQISPVVHAGLDRLRRCYERSLRRIPTLEGKLDLTIRVAPDGHVARASMDAAAELPAELEQCVLNEARSWSFPHPQGGAVTFEAPLNLKARR